MDMRGQSQHFPKIGVHFWLKTSHFERKRGLFRPKCPCKGGLFKVGERRVRGPGIGVCRLQLRSVTCKIEITKRVTKEDWVDTSGKELA